MHLNLVYTSQFVAYRIVYNQEGMSYIYGTIL